ncbi:uncharacterized protein LOC131640626 [Vicia villosa]|uniref:uncharacterized protein LOC131640626 n=1 Tax=Vicia villosa TaxID=3911 RepID=UPI00273BAFF0|nr:uncharacterized protein LOC131640626 [Vicia villosa]
MSVFVNGSPTKEFIIHRGLRQGDPLPSFLFVLVAEGLSGLVRQFIEVEEFQRFAIKDSCWVDILQFADDTLIVGDGNWKHVRAIKAWRWRILEGQNSLWYSILKSRYGDLTSIVFGVGKVCNVSSSFSFWWKDIVKIDSFYSYDPIVENSRFFVHNGYNTLFWVSNWLNGVPVEEEFQDLFEASYLKSVSMGGWKEERWFWGGLLGDNVYVNNYGLLKGQLEDFRGWKEGKDSLVWRGNSVPVFSVALCYDFYMRIRIPFGPPNKCDEAFGLL